METDPEETVFECRDCGHELVNEWGEQVLGEMHVAVSNAECNECTFVQQQFRES